MNYRNKKILDFARECPYCMHCRASNRGQIVGAHSNWIKHGKGKGIKAHDLVAYLCNHCHDVLDGRVDAGMSKSEKEMMFLDAVFFSTIWLLQTGMLVTP